jgi:hypothetical protein
MLVGIKVETKALPPSVKRALALVGYKRPTIGVQASETVNVRSCPGDGSRGYYIVLALDGSVEPRISYGSWGGANPFETRQVDVDDRKHPIPPGGAVIVGSTGGRGDFATLHVHPSNLARMLPAKTELTERQQDILEQWCSLSSAGRKTQWEYGRAVKPTDAEINELVRLGMLKRNKAGAISATVEGHNNRKGR